LQNNFQVEQETPPSTETRQIRLRRSARGTPLIEPTEIEETDKDLQPKEAKENTSRHNRIRGKKRKVLYSSSEESDSATNSEADNDIQDDHFVRLSFN
jgi:hypothetical protein